jgi:[acyl-carrier-protein] S-malonyltransferase
VAAGALKFEDALLLVHKRGKYMQEAVPVGAGAMAAVLGMGFEEIQRGLEKIKGGTVEIANWNSQDQIVIAGHKNAVEDALRTLNAPRAVMLPVSAPFHTSLMKSAEEKLAADLDEVEFKDPRFPIVTNVDARIIHKATEARDALKRQVSRPVLWHKSMEVLGREAIPIFVELGSGKVLSNLMRKISRNWPQPITMLNIENWESLEKAREALRGALRKN